MMSLISNFLTPFFLLSWLLGGAGADGGAAGRVLRVEPVFGEAPLVLDSVAYRTSRGETVYLSTLRFYLSAVRLTYADGRTYIEPNSYHLVDADPDARASLRIGLPQAPAGTLKSLSFSVGVDSVANTAGALGGDLDPARGMYWAWHSGYVNAKLEGHAPFLTTPHHEFAYHVGGFQAPHNTRRTLTLSVPAAIAANPELTLRADAGRWLNALSIKELPSVQVPGSAAMTVADACVLMFYLPAVPSHARN